MVDVEKIDSNEDFAQCQSCLKSAEETNIYKVEVGKTKNHTSTLKLCQECLINLGNQIYEIYRDITDFIDEDQ